MICCSSPPEQPADANDSMMAEAAARIAVSDGTNRRGMTNPPLGAPRRAARESSSPALLVAAVLRRRLRGTPLLVFVLESGNRNDFVVLFDFNQPNALRRASDRPDVIGGHADHFPLLRDQHQLVARVDGGNADNASVPVGGLDVDDAQATARLQPVLVQLGALAVPVLGNGQQRAAGAYHFHRNDFVIVAK